MQNKIKALVVVLVVLMMGACYRPPYNQFQSQQTTMLPASKANIVKDLERHDIQVVQYGETITLVVPTDRYYVFDSAKLHELQYPGLEAIVSLINLYPHREITVASFSDDVGSRRDKERMTDARAHTMVAFLWANGIASRQLHAVGLGSCFPIGDNHLIHGSAHNRRLEIQWRVNQTVHV